MKAIVITGTGGANIFLVRIDHAALQQIAAQCR